MCPGVQAVDRLNKMLLMRRADHHGVRLDGIQHRPIIVELLGVRNGLAMLLPRLLQARGAPVDYGRYADSVVLEQPLNMPLSNAAHADHSDTYGIRHSINA